MRSAASEETELPRWDMSPAFPSLESGEFREAFEHMVAAIRDLSTTFDARGIRRRETGKVDPVQIDLYEQITDQLNSLIQQNYTLGAYITCFTSTDANDEAAQKAQSELSVQRAKLDPIITRYVAWVGTTDIDALQQSSEVARSHAYFLRKARFLAAHQMSEAEELLAAQMRPVSSTAWANLHGNMSALLTAEVIVKGEKKMLPMSSVRALASDADRETRRAAYEAEIGAWKTVEVPFAAALNGIKGYQQLVRTKRGYADDVEPSLFANGIDGPSLEALQQACVESFPDFRRYLKAKARALGIEVLAWWDIDAPAGSASRVWSWSDASQFVLENFGRYSARMAEFADRAFRERWIDAGSRVGKEGGAYCTGLMPGVSRIMMNFDGSFGSVSTLAHELGHGYHNLNLKDRRPLQRETPSTLAETASIFCETLSFDAALASANREEKLVLLDTSLQRDLGVVVDIQSRFLFESAVFEKRAARDLTVQEFKDLILDGQRQTYGDAVDPLHPYMWAVKGHYYGPLFYNYPYTFGLLFGVGLYARFKQDPDGFRAQYDDFLSSTGLADAMTLAQRFDIDIGDVGFWRSSLDVIRRSIAEFERLADRG